MKKGRIRNGFLALFCFLVISAPVVLAEQLPLKSYTIADGLARDNISSIIQDSHGFLWFCTSEGLSRFDGYRFTNYGTRDGLPSRAINQFIETHDGAYWVATENGLLRFNPNVDPAGSHFIPVTIDQAENSRHVEVIVEGRAGEILCGTANGIYSLKKFGNEWRASVIDLGLQTNSPERNVNTLIEDSRGTLWVGTAGGLFHRNSEGHVDRFMKAHGLPVDNVRVLFEDRSGRIWVGTQSGVSLLVANPKRGARAVERVYTTTDGLANDYVGAMLQTSDGKFWVGTGLGLNLMEQTAENGTPAFRSYTRAQGLRNINVTCLTEDRDGYLWIGSESGGALKFARSGFTSYDESDGLGNHRIVAVFGDHAGNLYALSNTENNATLINRFDGRRFLPAPHLAIDAHLTWGWYQMILQDKGGDWWVPTDKGLYRFSGSGRFDQLNQKRPTVIYTEKDGMPGHSVFRLFEDSRGDLWFSTLEDANMTLGRWERSGKQFHRYTATQDGIPRSAPTAFAEDHEGNIWIGFFGGGVLRYRAERFAYFGEKEGVPPGLIRHLFVDHKGRLWIASGLGGLGRVNDPQSESPRFAALTSKDGLASDQITSIVEDDWGSLYVGTGRGLDYFDPETGRVKHYTTADGLADNFINLAFREPSGTLWFGTLRGLSRLAPQKERTSPPPAILINGLVAGDVRYPISELGTTSIEKLELTSSENRLLAEFSSLSFRAGETLRYQYLLEGAQKDWSAPTDRRTVNFANLSPGTYRFLVRAVSSDGQVSPQPASISFRVLPPIWRRWWFVALVVLTIGAALFALDRYRVARVKELDSVNRKLTLEYDVTRLLAESRSTLEAAPKILQAICENLCWEVGAIWDVDSHANVLRCVTVWLQPAIKATEFDEQTRARTFAAGEGLPGRVWATAAPLWIPDLSLDKNFPRIATASREALRSAFGFPILLGTEVIGVIEFFKRETTAPDKELLEIMSPIGAEIGQLLVRKQGEQALRESETRFRTLAETASDAIITIDERSTIIYINQAAETIFGYPVAEMLGADLTMLMPEYLRHVHRAGLSRYVETGRRHIAWSAVELPGLHKDGREVPLELSFGEFTKNDRRYFTGIARDITERKRAEEALRHAREERLRELERVRKRIATDLHDDIGSALTQISILSEVVHRRIGADDSPAAEPLAMIADSSRELVDSMSDIVWAINPQKDHLSDLLGRMRRFAADILTARNIEFQFRAPDAAEDVQLGANIRREVFLIFKESVNNVVKHSGCSRAEIRFQIDEDCLELTVSDNGKGFASGSDNDGHGLMSMRDRAAGLGAEFAIVSAPGYGTTITLNVPLSNNSAV